MTTNKLPNGSTWTSFKLPNVTSNQTVTFTFAPDTNGDGIPDKYNVYSVSSVVDGSGTVDPAKKSVTLGENVVFTVTPGEGQALYQIKVGDDIRFTNTADTPFGGTYTLENVTADTVVTFVFSADSDGDGIPDVSETWYTVTVTHDDNTNMVTDIPDDGQIKLKAGSDYTLQFNPASGYAIDTIQIDDTSYVNNGQTSAPYGDWDIVTISDIQANQTINITSSASSDDTGVPDKYKLTVDSIVLDGPEGEPITVPPQLVVYGKDVVIDIGKYLPENYAVAEISVDENTYINDPNYGVVSVNGVAGYDTLQNAVNDTVGPMTLSLKQDVAEPLSIESGKDVTVELNGNNIQTTGVGLNVNGGKLTIGSPVATLSNSEPGTISSSTSSPIQVEGGGELIINSGNFESPTNIGVRVGTYVEGQPVSTGKCTINGGTFTAQEFAVRVMGESECTINGGTFTANDNAVVGTNGTAGLGASTVTITNGIFNGNTQSSGYIGCGVYFPSAGTLTISGGTFNITNGLGVLSRAGATIINGGTFNVTGNMSGKVGDSKVITNCYGIMLDGESNYPDVTGSTVTLSGDVQVSSEADCVMLTKDSGDTVKFTVEGGKYNHEIPQEYLAEGKQCTSTEEGIWTVA